MPPEVEPAPDVVLRPAEAQDLPEVAELYLAVRRAAEPRMPPTARGEDEVRTWVAGLADRVEVWVAQVDPSDRADRIVGFAALTSTWLDALYVAPQHQRSGIGSALLDLAKSRRPDGFMLWVFTANTPARAFYRAHGLVELEHTDGSANEEQTPDVRVAWPGEDATGFLRREIDAVDDELAVLLGRRTALTAAVQDQKTALGAPGGTRGRDPDREAEIVERMAPSVPGLAPEQLRRVMHTVIEESLAAWEARQGP